MSETPALGLPLLAAEQAQKHVTMNEALAILDGVVQLAAKDRDLAAPPAAPAEGDRYIVAAAPTGAWAGQAGKIAVHQDGGWNFLTPREGWLAWVDDENVVLGYTGATWANLSTLISALQNLTLIGVGTNADATNPFSAKLNKALWTAKTAAEGGDGDLRYTINKETAADVLSLLLQTGFSGRAEIGLIGNDDLAFKVSTDGSSWIDAMTIDKTTGALRLTGGSASAPALQVGEANTGLHRPAAGKLHAAAAGVDRIEVDAAQVALFGPARGAETLFNDFGWASRRYSATVGGVSANLYRARGTLTAPTIILSGDSVSHIISGAYTGTQFRSVAEVAVSVTEPTPSNSALGGRMIGKLNALGTVSLGEIYRFEHATGFSMFGANPVIDENRHQRLRSYTIATLPAASAAAGQLIYCSDLGGGGGELVSDGTSWRRASRSGQQAVATDAAFTLTTLVSAERQRHTGTLTANRVVTLATTNAYTGSLFRVTRTGPGAFNLDIGGLKNLTQNTWCEVVYDGAAWYLTAYGAL